MLAHLGHPLVRLSLALLRAEVWGTGSHLHRVTLRYADGSLGAPVAVAHGRLVVTGRSGHRLHEQVIAAGVRLAGERARAAERGADRGGAAARTRHRACRRRWRERMVRRARRQRAEPLRAALQARAAERARQLRAHARACAPATSPRTSTATLRS